LTKYARKQNTARWECFTAANKHYYPFCKVENAQSTVVSLTENVVPQGKNKTLSRKKKYSHQKTNNKKYKEHTEQKKVQQAVDNEPK